MFNSSEIRNKIGLEKLVISYQNKYLMSFSMRKILTMNEWLKYLYILCHFDVKELLAQTSTRSFDGKVGETSTKKGLIK